MKARESAQVRGAFSDRYRDAAGLPKGTPIIIVLKEGVHDQHGTFGDVHPGGAVEQHGAGHGGPVQHGPDALGPRLCVPNDAIGNVVAGIGAQIALEHFEGCTGSLQ